MTKDDPDRTRVGGFPGLAEYLKSHVESRTGCLTLIQGHEADLGKHLVLQDRVVIGRSSECDLVIGDLQASRQHCDISVRADGSYAIRDLGSTNGTQVGTLPLEGSVSLRDGDKVFIGETVLRFFLADDIDLEFAGQVGYLLGTDALTGLQSKRKFDHRLELSLRVAARRGECLSVLMMDLDGLKRINDRHGQSRLYYLGSTRQVGERRCLEASRRELRQDRVQRCRRAPTARADVMQHDDRAGSSVGEDVALGEPG
ncbi:MAG: FHA domain-containing protein [Gemmatimonadales bacterium]